MLLDPLKDVDVDWSLNNSSDGPLFINVETDGNLKPLSFSIDFS